MGCRGKRRPLRPPRAACGAPSGVVRDRRCAQPLGLSTDCPQGGGSCCGGWSVRALLSPGVCAIVCPASEGANGEANLPAQEAAAPARARVSRPDGRAGRPARAEAPPGEGQAPVGSLGVPLEASRLGRLTREEEFRQVYRRGVRRSSALLVIHALPTRTGVVRIGLAVRRPVGPAVVRNRIRRRIREAVRAERHVIRCGVDLVVSPREAAARAPFCALRREIRGALEACGIVAVRGETVGWSREDCCC